jgi:two-component sensor histidine kinase
VASNGRGPYLKRPGNGEISIKWGLNGGRKDKRLQLEWVEHDLDGDMSKPSREGFGLELLNRILLYDLDARTSVAFQPSGLSFSMELPVEHLASRTDGGR